MADGNRSLTDYLNPIAIGSSVLGGIFQGVQQGQQNKLSREMAQRAREDEIRRWQSANPLRQQLAAMLQGKLAQPSPRFSGYDFYSDPGQAPPSAAPPPDLQEFFRQRLTGGGR